MRLSREATVFGLLSLIWGTTWAAIRVSLAGIPPLAGVGLRFALAGLLLLAWARWRGVAIRATPEARRLWAIQTLTTFAGSYSIVYWAEQWVPSGLASVLFATFSLWVALLARLWLPGERLSATSLTAIAAGFVGVAVIFSEDFARLGDEAIRRPAALLLLAPLISAFGAVSVKRWGSGVHPLSLTAVPCLLSALLLLPLSLASEDLSALAQGGAAPWLALLYLAAAGTALTFTLWYWLIERVRATSAGLIGYSVPVVAVLFGAVTLGEPVTPRMVAGGLLVLVGVAAAIGRPTSTGRGSEVEEPAAGP